MILAEEIEFRSTSVWPSVHSREATRFQLFDDFLEAEISRPVIDRLADIEVINEIDLKKSCGGLRE